MTRYMQRAVESVLVHAAIFSKALRIMVGMTGEAAKIANAFQANF
jgi:hypothetical protein